MGKPRIGRRTLNDIEKMLAGMGKKLKAGNPRNDVDAMNNGH